MISKEELLDIYEMMHRIRKFEEKAIDLYSRSIIGGSMHLYIGQEAIAATVGKVLKKDDYISSTHRGHGHILGKGARLDKALAELMGKSTGFCKGRGGSMHIADTENGILGANGVVGGGIPAAVGAGLSAKLQKDGKVSVVYFGDGASNQGTFHESVNLAALWKLPVIFVCENNLYGMTVPLKESTSVEDIAVRAAAYGIPGVTVDGNDVFAIYEATSEAVKRARAGEGPSLIECKTYRWRGHWEGDPLVYRTEEELEEWKKKCPIARLEKSLIKDYKVSKDTLEEIVQKVANELEEAEKFARNSPDPDPKDLLDDVFTI